MLRLVLAIVLALVVGQVAAQVQRVVPQSRGDAIFSYAPVVKRVTPAVVNVYASRTVKRPANPLFDDPFFRQFFGNVPNARTAQSLGSGVIVDRSGLIVTNQHVIEGMTDVKVALSDKREFPADIVLRDPTSDLAVLKIKGGSDFPVLDLGNSDVIEVGDLVLAVGNPFAVGQTVTQGIISALARPERIESESGLYIQTDAAINPGNSGGPLLDTHSRLIGMNTAIASRTGQNTGVGFSIPVTSIARVVPQLIQKGRVVRPEIGIARVYQTERGLLIATLAPGGPAEAAGLRGPKLVRERKRQGPFVYETQSIDRTAADLIVAVDGQRIKSADEFLSAIESKRPGEEVSLTIVRDAHELQLRVRLGETQE